MATWLSGLLEIVKLTIPALIVFFTVYYLLKIFLEKQYELKLLAYRQEHSSSTILLRLQSYERLTLFCERISIPNLTFRLKKDNQSVIELRIAMLLAMQQEFEYNLTQQIYISNQLWAIIKVSRDDTANIINLVAEKFDPKTPSIEFIKLLLQYVDQNQPTTLDKALIAISKEASLLM